VWTRRCTTRVAPSGLNLSVNQDLIEQAKAAGIPSSETLEEALVARWKAKRQAERRQENRSAIAALDLLFTGI
jgi:post-segregation antitoxin (ccd killing protein)